MTAPLKLYVSKADANAGNAEFQRMKALADKLDLPLTHVTDEMITLTRSQARDSAQYLAAREAARGVGKQVTISNDPPKAEPKPGALDARQFLVTADSVYLTGTATRDTRTYQRLKAEAARDHKTLKPIRTWADLPEAEREQLEASLKEA